jgi:hypothetical protein
MATARGFELRVFLNGDQEMRVCADGLSVNDTLKRKLTNDSRRAYCRRRQPADRCAEG